MKRCELCSHLARMYCHSDNASLCYDCDQAVHSANFLVAKHSRTLLCHKCQSATPWIASGLNLGRAVSLCVNCLDQDSSGQRVLLEGETSHRRSDVLENGVVHETDDDDAEYGDESEDEDDETQVVPCSTVASPPAAASPSTSEEFPSSRLSSDDTICSSRSQRLMTPFQYDH